MVADLATYAALKSFLIDRIDSSLVLRQPAADQPADRADPTRPASSASDATSRAALAAAAPGAYVELRDANNGRVVSGSTRGDYATAVPSLPGPRLRVSRPNDVRYLTVDAKHGGPRFRLRSERALRAAATCWSRCRSTRSTAPCTS